MVWQRWVLAWLGGVALLSGCGGGGGCLLDSDCRSFQEVCVARQCVPVGTVLDAGPRDAAMPPRDAGRDGGTDAGPPDAGPLPDAGPTCEDVSGSWIVSALAGGCGAAVEGYGVTLTASSPCEQVASSDVDPALDGTFTIDEAGFASGTLSTGGEEPVSCTGMRTEGGLQFVCDDCVLDLARP